MAAIAIAAQIIQKRVPPRGAGRIGNPLDTPETFQYSPNALTSSIVTRTGDSPYRFPLIKEFDSLRSSAWSFRGLLHQAFPFLTAALFSITLGCGDDDNKASDVTFTCENCNFWDQVLTDNSANPSYYPFQPADGEGRIIAVSSDRGNSTNTENIWIVSEDGDGNQEFFQMTESDRDELDPAWSPTGDRIAFMRALPDRYDIFVIDATNWSDPGDEIRVTSESPIPGDDQMIEFDPRGPVWLSDDEILFSNSINVYVVTLDEANEPITLEKVINDPSDFVLSSTADFIESQPTGIRRNGSTDIYFVSDSRVALGAIDVTALDAVTRDGVEAEIFLEGRSTETNTPNIVGGRPLGAYVVGAIVSDDEAVETYCDTLLTTVINVFENDTAAVDFEFENDRGSFRIITTPAQASVQVDGFSLSDQDFTDTVIVDCIFPGVDHIITMETLGLRDLCRQLARDSVIASVGIRDTVEVRLDATNFSLEVIKDPLDTADGCCDTIPNSDGGIDRIICCSVRADCFDCDRERFDCDTTVFGGGGKWAEEAQEEFPEPTWNHGDRRKVAMDDPVLWFFNSGEGAYAPLSDGNGLPSHPTISHDGMKLAVVFDFTTLFVVDFFDSTLYRIPLPGEVGVNECIREIIAPTWSPDDLKIAISLTPCTDRPSTDGNAPEYHVWEVDFEDAKELIGTP